MTTLFVDRVQTPASHREERVLDAMRRRAAEELSGRTVWTAAAQPRGRTAAARLRERLREQSRLQHVPEPTDEPLHALARHVQALLAGQADSARAGRAARAAYAEAASAGDAAIERDVRPDDVVVLHDPFSTALTGALRDRGVHVVWRVQDDAVWAFLRSVASGDAYVMAWDRGASALIPSTGEIMSKDVRADAPYCAIGWASLLSDVVQADRHDTIGGRRHARPAVPAR